MSQAQGAQVYSGDRPLFALGPQTPLYKLMQDYANQPAVQELLQKLTSDLVTDSICRPAYDRPEDALAYLCTWCEKEKSQRDMPQNTYK